MAELKIDGRMTVAAFIEQFQSQFPGVLKVYKDRNGHLADERERLANVQMLRAPKSGFFQFRSDISVGSFCERLYEEYGLMVDVFRREGRVTMLDNIALSDMGNVPYQASKREMEQFARYMAKEIEDLDLKKAADELYEKGKRVKNPDGRKDIEDAVAFIDELNESKQSGRLDKVVSFFDKYPLPEFGGILSAIVSGNFLGLGVETLRTLVKLAKLFNNQ
jgi:hypothetical protein